VGRINDAFDRLAHDGKKGFIPFITAGDPDLDTTLELILELDRTGATVIELGIPFTDPIRLQNDCGIPNIWPKKQELSSLFIYNMIDAFSNAKAFYNKFYITAISPLGFTKHNKNCNYYDDKNLLKDIKGFVVDCMNKQLLFGIDRSVAFCLGDGKNYKYLSKLNEEQQFFKKVIPLPHPRFIMQYKLKSKDEYIQYYLRHLKS